MYRVLKLVAWVSMIYIVFSCVGILFISFYRPDIRVVETVPFIISVVVGSIAAYVLGGIVDGEKKK